MENRFLGVGVYGRKRIVEDKDSRVAHNGTRYRRTLFLATGKRDAAFADELLIFAGKFLDVFSKAGDRGGFFDGYFTTQTQRHRVKTFFG